MRDAEERILDNGYEDVVIFTDYSYDDALIGVTHDNRAVYDYDLMVDWLVRTESFSEEEAVDWIDFNTIRLLPGSGVIGPVVMYPLRD